MKAVVLQMSVVALLANVTSQVRFSATTIKSAIVGVVKIASSHMTRTVTKSRVLNRPLGHRQDPEDALRPPETTSAHILMAPKSLVVMAPSASSSATRTTRNRPVLKTSGVRVRGKGAVPQGAPRMGRREGTRFLPGKERRTKARSAARWLQQRIRTRSRVRVMKRSQDRMTILGHLKILIPLDYWWDASRALAR